MQSKALCYKSLLGEANELEWFMRDCCEGTTMDYSVKTGGRERPHGKRFIKGVRIA